MTGLVDLSPAHLAIVEHILAEHVPECEVRAFGSRATWNAKDHSDLDLVVVGDEPLPRRTLTVLKEAFEESRLPMCVDVVDWHAIADDFRESIEADCVTVQEALLRAGWREVQLNEIADLIMGQSPPSSTYNEVGEGLPFFQGVRDFNYRHPTPRVFCSSPTRVAHAGDILLSVRAPIGRVNIADRECATGRGIAIVRARRESDVQYIEYALRHLEPYWDALETSGSVFGNATKRDLESLSLPWSDDEAERRAIARVLGALDDRIELNRRMSETLEEMTKALFKSWFVDFDPVRAKAKGQPSGLPPDLDALFPASFETSELGEVPSGWEVKTLGDVFCITMGQSPPGKTYNQDGKGLPFYQGRTDFGFRFPGRRVYCTEPTRFAEKGDSLVSVRAPVGDINMAMESCCVGRGVAAVRHLSGSCSYTYYSMRALRDTFQQFEAEGTVFGAIGKRDFLSMRWVSPPNRLIEQFDESCSVMDHQIETNEIATSLLAVQRDTLLPRVLSGDLRIAF